MSALQEKIAEEWRRREKKGSSSRSAATTGLLAEMQPVQRAARELNSLLEEIAEEEEATEAEVGVNEERAVEVVERAEALAAACRVLAKGLAPLEQQVRAVFHRVVASCGEVVHYMEHSVHSANAAPSASAVSNSSGGDRKYDKICIWESDGDITCDIVDGAALADEVVVARRSVRTDDGSEGSGLPPPSPAPHIAKWVPPREAKRQGETIAKGDKNYELMLNLQLGIRHAVGKQGPITLDLKSSAFDPKEKVWTKFPPEGSKYTPPHNSCDFRWKDYCPQVFRTLRKLFEVDAADYMLSLCGSEALRELSSPGKSGSFFYLTNDDRYMIKTMKKSEVKMLLKMLPAYYNHVRAFENTLVAKFFGLHCVKLSGANQKKVRFVIMGNLFCSDYSIHRRFDLKGSSLGRTTDKPQTEIDQYTTLKDLDLNFIFRLKKQWFQEFQRQVDRDCDFLEQEKIMDYSLLVGVHFRDNREKLLSEGSTDNDINEASTPRLSRGNTDQFLADPNRWSKIKLGANMPARAELTARKNDCESQLIGEPTGEYYDVILYFGIIDILQDYDISKKLEHAYKSFQYDSTSISAVDPRQYSRRFKDFIYNAFQEHKLDR